MSKLQYLDLLGKEFELGASGPELYDCYHLCKEVLRRVGYEVPKYISPETPADIHDLIEKEKVFVFEMIDKPEPYSIVFLQVVPRFVTHCAVVLEDCINFIHIFPKSRVSVESLESIVWRHRIRGYGRCMKTIQT